MWLKLGKKKLKFNNNVNNYSEQATIYVYIYIYICVCVCVCVYIYVYLFNRKIKCWLTREPTRAFWKALRTRVVLRATKWSTSLNSEYNDSTASFTCIHKMRTLYQLTTHHMNLSPLKHKFKQSVFFFFIIIIIFYNIIKRM